MSYLKVTNKYGKAGDLVEVVNTQHGDVYLCQMGSGGIFAMHKDKLSDEKRDLEPEQQIQHAKKTTNTNRTKSVAKPVNTGDVSPGLF